MATDTGQRGVFETRTFGGVTIDGVQYGGEEYIAASMAMQLQMLIVMREMRDLLDAIALGTTAQILQKHS